MDSLLQRIPQKFWAYLALIIWGVLCFKLLSSQPYGIDEGAARALLLVWSVAGDVVSPVVTLGLPDFRTLFFIPAGYLWPGNIVAAKIFSLLIMASAVWALHRWRQESGNTESALIASGLLLISPLTVMQIDTVSVAPYMLLVFAWGAWLDRLYRDTPRAFGGLYFFQIILCLISTTLHPAGLAYPLALLWGWHKNPVDEKQKKYFISGIIFTLIFGLLLTMGWSHISWLSNPFRSLSGIFSGTPDAGNDLSIGRWLLGIGIFIIAASIIAKKSRELRKDTLGRILLIAFVTGLFSGDANWAELSLTLSLYWGLPLLLQSDDTGSGFWGQRGPALLLIFGFSIFSMLADKAHYLSVQSEYLVPRDSLLKTFAEDSGYFPDEKSILGKSTDSTDNKRSIKVASQWPGLTMLACRCDAFPLPKPDLAKDGNSLLAILKNIDFVIFDPKDPSNSSLSQNLAIADAEKIETVSLQPGGAIVRIKKPQEYLPHASTQNK